jgi:hypothetical protein
MTIGPPPEMFVVIFEISSAKKIPLDPPLSKGDVFRAGLFPLFGKEGQGEIFGYSNRQRIRL